MITRALWEREFQNQSMPRKRFKNKTEGNLRRNGIHSNVLWEDLVFWEATFIPQIIITILGLLKFTMQLCTLANVLQLLCARKHLVGNSV